MVETKVYRAKYQVIETVCEACGENDETTEDVFLYCQGLQPCSSCRGHYRVERALEDGEGKTGREGRWRLLSRGRPTGGISPGREVNVAFMSPGSWRNSEFLL